MSRRLKVVAVGVVFVFAAAQLVRPKQAHPPTGSSPAVQSPEGMGSALAPILHRGCGDCHSNETAWPWYARVAPLSWLMAKGVTLGRQAVNFSDWAAYSAAHRRTLLAASCNDVSRGAMPGRLWILLHPEARLSPQDVETICAAARQTAATASTARLRSAR
jgi:hypothetical protein